LHIYRGIYVVLLKNTALLNKKKKGGDGMGRDA